MKVKFKVRKNKPQTWKNYILGVFMLICFIIFISLSFLKKGNEKLKPHVVKDEPQREDTPQETTPRLSLKKVFIQKKMTISEILIPFGFSPQEIQRLKKEVSPVFDLSKIRAGHELRMYFTLEEELKLIEYDIDSERYLSLERGDGRYFAELKKIPFEIKKELLFGVIENNLISSILERGEQVSLALKLSEIFAWDIDFYTDLRRGDRFRMIFEKKYLKGNFVGYGEILAAEFTSQGRTFKAYRFSYPGEERWDYFDSEGNSLRKEFLKSPIPYARITSRFTSRRFHPVRKIFRPHFGVDYAAPVGTPVQATADGIVTFAGWNGASGKMVRIRHANFYETMYLHLKSLPRGISVGARVKAGEIIGYVGSTGESTGPHLDYRIKYRGSYINPLAWRFKPVEPLHPEFLDDFKAEVEVYKLMFRSPEIIISSFLF